MSERSIFFDLDTLDNSASGAVYGVISFVLRGNYFPERAWNDRIAVVVTSWLHDVSKLAEGEACLLRFMDGPYFLRVVRGQEDVINCFGVERMRNGESLIFQATESFGGFLRDLLCAGEKICTECVRRGWAGVELENLQFVVDRVRNGNTPFV